MALCCHGCLRGRSSWHTRPFLPAVRGKRADRRHRRRTEQSSSIILSHLAPVVVIVRVTATVTDGVIPTMLSTREVFPNAPLAMVVAEIRYSYNPQLDQPADKAKVLDAIKADLPVWQRRTENTFGLALGIENAQITPSSTVDLLEAKSADSQVTAALSAEMLTLAMSGKAYAMFEESLRPLLTKAVAGLHAQFPETLVTRAGLRYLDEIRVPEQPTTLGGWAPWIAMELLGGVDLLAGSGGRVVAMRSSYQYALSANRSAVLNW